MAQVSDRVRRLRKERGLTQEEVARRARLTLNSYGDIERGHVRDPHLSSLEAIARALRVPIEALVSQEIAVPLADVPEETGPAEEERRSTLTQLFEDVRTLIVNAADRWTHAAETGLMFSSEDAALTYSLEINAEAAQLYGFVAEGLEPALEGLLSGTLTLRSEQRKLWEAMEHLKKAVEIANNAADAVAPPSEPTEEEWAAAGPILDAIWEEMDEVKQHRLLREFAEEMAAECEQAAADRRGRIGA